MDPEENYYSHFEGLLTTKQLTSLKKYLKGLEKEMKFFSLLGASQRLNFSHDQLDYFISRSKWNERGLNRLRCQMDVQSSQNKYYDLVVDDGGILKYTMRPYFVAKGWIGNMGKVDKCFCNVFANFIGAADNIPFEVETYLPSAKLAAGKKDWEFRSKLEIFIELVQRVCLFARENRLEIVRILFDSWFAAGWVLNKLHFGHTRYFTEIRSNRCISVAGKDWMQVKDLVTVLLASSKQITYRHKSFSVISFTGRLKEVTHPVKIFIVKGRFRTKVETRLFITNDLTVSDEQVFEFLAKRAEIEYFFRESKTYLGLDQGKYQKLKCYRRHFYICILVWSISRRYIKQKVGAVKTMHSYIMLKNCTAA